MVSLENRFYGASRPTKLISNIFILIKFAFDNKFIIFRDLSNENLKHLTVEQVIEDLANFHNYIHSKYNLTSKNKWISFGGSYSGVISGFVIILFILKILTYFNVAF